MMLTRLFTFLLLPLGCLRGLGAEGQAETHAEAKAVDLIAAGQAAAAVNLLGELKCDVTLPGTDRKVVQVTLDKGKEWPGITIAFARPQDWSGCTALKFDLRLDSEMPLAFHLRVDNERSSDQDYKSRFNLGGVKELEIKPGDHRLRISMERLINGVVNNPGLDISRITKITLFTAQPPRDASLYVRRVWLETVPPPFQDTFVLADFAQEDGCKDWAAEPKEFDLSRVVDPAQGRACTIKAHPEGSAGWALGGITCRSLSKGDWQVYDGLEVAVFNPEAGDLLAGLTVHDREGKELILRFRLKTGRNNVFLPLAAAQTINLEELADAALWFDADARRERQVYLSRLSLVRLPGRKVVLEDTPGDTAGPGDWRIELSRFFNPRGDRLLADLLVPSQDGARFIVVRCRPRTTRAREFVLPAEVVKECRTGGFGAVGWYVNHGETMVYSSFVVPDVAQGAATISPREGVGP